MLKIRDVRSILTAPENIPLVIVKVETSDPDIYGVGCATFAWRAFAVASAVEDYLKPLLIGKNADDIEDIYQMSHISSYWRNGPVLNNAISGVDQALWDIKGKQAGMPVYQLLGGKCREAAAVYVHASGASPEEVEEKVLAFMDDGFHYNRVQIGIPGYSAYGVKEQLVGKSSRTGPKVITDYKEVFEPMPYVRRTIDLFEHLRTKLGFEVELLHDVHERIPPVVAMDLAKELECYKLFFLEDLFAPEDIDYFKLIRNQCSVPMAMGELFNNPHEYIDLIKERLIDFIRVHISQIGGLSMARKLATLCEFFGVRTAWHGPGDTSPVGHAANLMLDLACHNFGIQEYTFFGDNSKAVFPGCPEVRDGYMWSNDEPGLGIDIDEKLASKFPIPRDRIFYSIVRGADGTVIRP